MEKRKLILVPVLVCVFTLILFIQTDENKLWNISFLKNNIVSFYEMKFKNNTNTSRLATQTELKNIILKNFKSTYLLITTKPNSTNLPISTKPSSTNSPILTKPSSTNSPNSLKSNSSNSLISTKPSSTNSPISTKPSSTHSPISTKLSSTNSPISLKSNSSNSPISEKSIGTTTLPTTIHKTISKTNIITQMSAIRSTGTTRSASVGTTLHLTSVTKGSPVSSTSIPSPRQSNNSSSNTTHFLCPTFMGRFGNTLFQLASTFGIARSKNMSVVVGTNTELNRTFKLNVDLRNDTSVCNSLTRKNEQFNCAYDPNLLKFNGTQNLKIGLYLQSWKYFYEFRIELRKQLTFRDNIQIEANKTINKILEKFNISSRGEVTLVGVHIRRGDMVNHSFGYNVATPEYLSKSVQYFQSKYKNIIFVIATQDKKWTRTHMPNNTIVEYLSHPKREFLVAILASCDHTITTVGSFGWWIGWLTGGEVTYFKWPAKEGSSLRKQFSKDYSDYFYPGWIGI